MTVNSDMTVSLHCSEHQDSFYTFGTQQEVATIPNTTLPNVLQYNLLQVLHYQTN